MANEIIPDSSPNPESALGYDGTDFRTLKVDAAGHTQVDILTAAADSGLATQTTLASILTELGEKLETGQLSFEDVTKYLNVAVRVSVLPLGAATSAKQDTMITLLQVIDDLEGALASAGIDQLAVKGQDQLFSYKAQVLIHATMTATAATMILTTDPVPSGEVWVITSASVRNVDRAVPAGDIGIKLAGDTYYWLISGSTTGASFYISFSGHMYLEAGNRVAFYVTGCTVDDTLEMSVNGYKMTKES